ncbi:MAG TPA: PA domain-containing protein [Verrucomicrobiae bacterium]|nr:PA domain-containing protein [Verrucomicrobiae bacterium]
MKKHRSTSRMGLAVLTGGLAFVGSASATELIVDGSFENTVPSSNPVVKVGGTPEPAAGGGWTLFSTYLYSTLYTLPGPANSGLQYLRPYASGTYGITQSSEVVTQTVNLVTSSLTGAEIDQGLGEYTMSAWFSSYLTQGDFSTLTVEFLDVNGGVVGSWMLGGSDFIVNIPTGANSKYPDAKEWALDTHTDAIPLDARTARVIIQSTSRSGAPDGYVDNVSLDVRDISETTPFVVSATPANNAVQVGPVVSLNVAIKDRVTAVDTSSVQLFLDSNQVTPIVEKVDVDTTVRYDAGLLPALSPHIYRLIFADNGTPARRQTNQFQFTVADYLTLPASLRTPLGSEDAAKPGFNVKVYQVDTLTDPLAAQPNLTESIELSEAVLQGLVGDNVAKLDGAESGNSFAVPDVINWVNTGGATANFPGDTPFPGIPGNTGNENSFVDEILTYVRFPAAGYYRMGINNEDQFRLSAGSTGTLALRMDIQGGDQVVLPCVAIATNITQLQFGGPLPIPPLTKSVVYATPSGNPDDSCTIGGDPSLSGMIVFLDRGGAACDTATKAEQAQLAGAVAVIMTTPGDTGFPNRSGDINPNVHIPVAIIAENYGANLLRSLLLNFEAVSATFSGDPAPRLAEWDGPKGFGAVDVTFGFAVPEAGIYPLRLVAGQRAGTANLEWFSIQPDGTRILVNDPSNADSLRVFRARSVNTAPHFNPPTVTNGRISISWTGGGVLQETTTLGGTWSDSTDQTNPQLVQPAGASKFYRIKR